MEEISSERQNLVSKLHKLIRSNKWKEVRQMLQDDDKSAGIGTAQKVIEQPLMLLPNVVGWTAVHVATAQGAPSLQWWKWNTRRKISII